MARKARIGLIGGGWWPAVNHLPILKANDECDIVAVNRLGGEELAELQRKFEVPLGFEDYRAMLDQVPMDGAVISSPHVLHYEHAVAALAKGCHLLVEKPLKTTAADARDLVAKADAAGKQVIVAYGRNFKAWTDEARALVAKGEIGRIEHIVLQMASALEDLFAGMQMKETEGHMFRPPPSWADPARAGGYGWGQLVHALGLLFRSRSRVIPRLRHHRQVADRRRLLRCNRRAIRKRCDRFHLRFGDIAQAPRQPDRTPHFWLRRRASAGYRT
jgi:predicted dehydrogenase